MVVKYARKGEIIVDAKRLILRVVDTEAELLKKLVAAELDRRCAGIDDIILRVYDVVPAKHTEKAIAEIKACLLYTSPSPRDRTRSRMPSSA